MRVGIRLSLATMRDDLIVPQARAGAGFGLALRYAGADETGVLRAELGFGTGYARASLGTRGVVFDRGLRVRYAFTLGGRGWRPWRVGIGPAFGWETDLAYLETLDDARTYAMTNRWLGVTVSAWHDLSARWRLELAAEVLLVTLQSRTQGRLGREPATLDALLFDFDTPSRDLRLVAIDATQRVRLGIDLWRPWSRAAIPSGWALGAEARFIHTTWGESVRVIEFALHFTYLWGLR